VRPLLLDLFCGAGMEHISDRSRWHDVAEAIPPAYTEHIGRQLIEAL